MDNLRGSLLMIAAMLGFAVEDMFIKLAAQSLPVGQILIVLGLVGAVAYGLWGRMTNQPGLNLSMLKGASGLRALAEGIAGLCFVSALALVPLSLMTTVIQANPLLVTLGAALFFKSPVGWRRWTAIVVGLIGVLIVLRPFGETFEPAVILAVIGVIAMSARDLATRRVAQNISTAQLSQIGFLVALPGGLLALAVAGTGFVWPGPFAALMLACASLVGIPALYAIIAAMRIGDISFVAPFRYSRIVFGLLLGYLVFNEQIDTYTLLGAAIIIGSGLYTFWRETRTTSPALPTTL